MTEPVCPQWKGSHLKFCSAVNENQRTLCSLAEDDFAGAGWVAGIIVCFRDGIITATTDNTWTQCNATYRANALALELGREARGDYEDIDEDSEDDEAEGADM